MFRLRLNTASNFGSSFDFRLLTEALRTSIASTYPYATSEFAAATRSDSLWAFGGHIVPIRRICELSSDFRTFFRSNTSGPLGAGPLAAICWSGIFLLHWRRYRNRNVSLGSTATVRGCLLPIHLNNHQVYRNEITTITAANAIVASPVKSQKIPPTTTDQTPPNPSESTQRGQLHSSSADASTSGRDIQIALDRICVSLINLIFLLSSCKLCGNCRKPRRCAINLAALHRQVA